MAKAQTETTTETTNAQQTTEAENPETEPKKRWPDAANWKAVDSLRWLANFERQWALVPETKRQLVWSGILDAVKGLA